MFLNVIVKGKFKSKILSSNLWFGITSLCLLFFQSASSQSDSTMLRSPYVAIETHLDNLQSDNYKPEIAAKTIPHVITESARRAELAIKIKNIFDAKSLFIEMSKIPRNPNFIDSLSGDAVFIPFPEKLPEIYLERIDGLWFYSDKTCEQVDKIYSKVFPFNLEKIILKLPEKVQKSFLGVKIWQYLGIISIIGLAWLFSFSFNFLIDRLILGSRWYKKLQLDDSSRPILHQFVGFGIMVFLLTVIEHLVPSLLLDVKISKVLFLLLEFARTCFIALALFKVISLINKYLQKLADKSDSRLDDQLLPILTKLSKVVIGAIAVIHILAISGVNVTALIAGVSIGGLALALAAQDTVKNLIGSVMIFFDKPFQIGDFVQTPELEGTVEEVGFRSTRMRKVDSSLVSVPNGNLSNFTLVNLGARKLRLFEVTSAFTYDSPPDKMAAFIQDVRAMLGAHPKVDQELKFVYFRNMSASSLDVFIRAYLRVATLQEELEARQELLFTIMKIAANHGLSFAFPSTSVYIESPDSKEEEK